MKEKLTAMVNDQRLVDIAKYKCSNGMMEIPTPEKVQKEFVALKKRIKSGRTTVSKLEETVFTKYGIQEEYKEPSMGATLGFGPGGSGGPEGPEQRDTKKIEGFSGK